MLSPSHPVPPLCCCCRGSSSHAPFPGITPVLLLSQSPASHTFLLPHVGVGVATGFGVPSGGRVPLEGLLWWHLSLCTKPHLLDWEPRAEEPCSHVRRGWFALSSLPTAPAALPAGWIPSARECLLMISPLSTALVSQSCPGLAGDSRSPRCHFPGASLPSQAEDMQLGKSQFLGTSGLSE